MRRGSCLSIAFGVVMGWSVGWVGLSWAKGPDCSCSREWVQTFRGNQHRAFYGTGFIPARLRVRWKFRTRWIRDSRLKGYGGRMLIWRGTGWSGQAAVVGDRVWASSVGGVLYCLNRHTGRQIWSFTAGLSIKSSVTYWNNRVYFGSRSNHIYCVDATTGRLLWKFHTPGNNVDSTPIIWKGVMYWGAEDSHLYAMNPLNGKVIWKYKTMGSIESSPMIYQDKVYINSFDGHMHCVDRRTGRLIWRFRTGDDTDVTPVFYRGVVYLGSENGFVFAVNADTGELLWKRRTDGGVWSTPSLAGNRMFFGSNDRRVYSLDARTGRLLWKYRTGDGVWASTVHLDGRILVGDWAGFLHVLRATDGERIFRIRMGVEYRADGNHIVSTASVVDGRVYIGSRDGHFYCLEGPRETTAQQMRQSERWRRSFGEDRELVVMPAANLPPVSTSAEDADLKSNFAVAAVREGLVRGLISQKLEARLLIARLLKRRPLPKAAGLSLLKKLLQDRADHVRLEAVRASMSYGAEGVREIEGLLDDPDGRVRAATCEALGKLGRRELVEKIKSRLWDPVAMVQASCARALFLLGDRSGALVALRRLLFGGNQYRSWSRKRGSRAGRFFCPNRVSKYFLYRNKAGKVRRSPREKQPILHGLLTLHKMGDDCGKKHLFSRWYSCDGDRETGACSIYSDWQGWMQRWLPMKIVPLEPKSRQLRVLQRVALPRYKDNNLRANGYWMVGTLNDPKREATLIQGLQREKYPLLRVFSARGLGRVESAAARQALEKALQQDKDPDVRVAAARSLVKLRKQEAVAALAKQLEAETRDRAKAGIASLLARLGHTQSQATLRAMLQSPSMFARCQAMRGLVTENQGLQQVRTLFSATSGKSLAYLRLCAIRALVALGKKGAKSPMSTEQWKEMMTQLSSHQDPNVSLRAAFAASSAL